MQKTSFILVLLFLVPAVRAEAPVDLPDPNLKAAVEDALWRSDPTPTDMLELTSLHAAGLEIRDLTGLGYATNLQILYLRYNYISDISPLGALENLEHLVLHRNWISDLSPLGGMTKLYHLNLDDNQISDISPLAGLENLEELILFDNQVSDISPLTALTSLVSLDLRLNPLNEDAYSIHIPQITANNPGINIQHDRGPYCLSISSTAGGRVINPGEGDFTYDDGTAVLLEAVADPCFVFVGFFGSWSTTENPTMLFLTGDYQIQARFESVFDVLYVDDDAPGDSAPGNARLGDPGENGTLEHPLDGIQEAIEVAANGTTIIVRPGNYRDNLNFLDKSLQVIGHDPNETAWPIIEAASAGPVIRIANAEDPNCLMAGFVITGARGHCSGVIHGAHANFTVANCLFAGNRPGGASGALVYCEDSDAAFVNCTMADNYMSTCGGGFRVADSHVTLTNSIFWGNTYNCWSTANNGFMLEGAGTVRIEHSNVPGPWAGPGNIEADPLFARLGRWVDRESPNVQLGPGDPEAVWVMGDYHLQSRAGRWDARQHQWVPDATTSPCIDGGDPSCPTGLEPQPDGGIINMGVYGGTAEASKSDL